MKIGRGKDESKNNNRRSISERLEEQREVLKWGRWRIYLYWAWRFVLFLLFLVVAVNLEIGNGAATVSLGHISVIEWTIVLGLGVFGPGIFVGWSYIWMWFQD